MSRIRTIKPEFWTSEQVVSCSLVARLLFIGLWNFSDDHGVHPASYVRIKAEVFPMENFSVEEIKHYIAELIRNELLREYIVEEKSYWIITGWKKHQRIDKPTYRHPLPLSELNKVEDGSSSSRVLIDDNSTNAPRYIADDSVTERNGKERNGEDKKTCEANASPLSGFDPDIVEIFSYWQQVMNHPHAKLDSSREAVIKKALKLYSVAHLKQAIDGCANTPFNMGKNDSKKRYDDLGLILRDSEHIDRYVVNATHNKPVNPDDVMAGVL